MSFNLKKKSQNVNKSVLPTSSALEGSTERKQSLSDNKFIPNFNTLLDEDRRPIKNVVLLQAQLDEKRAKASKLEKTIEGSLNDADSPLFPHRQVEDQDSHDVAPVNVLSEAYDNKYREEFAKLNKDANTEFWDKYIGVQLDDKDRKKVPAGLPNTGSQLQNNPSRFTGLDSVLSDRMNSAKVRPMSGFNGKGKGINMFDSLREADKLMFQTYTKAASEKRELTADEKELIVAINKDKTRILLSQITPQPIQGPVDPNDRGTDFLDGGQNPSAGDPALWGQLSGGQTEEGLPEDGLTGQELNEEVQGMPSLESMPPLPQDGQTVGQDESMTGDVNPQDVDQGHMTSIKPPSVPQNNGAIDGNTTPF